MLRSSRWPLALAAVLAVTAVGAGTVGAKTSKKGKATSGTVYVAQTPQTNSSLEYLAGAGTDKVLGSVAITYTIKASPKPNGSVKVTAKKVTLWTKTGTLSGTGSATLTVTNTPAPGDAAVSNGVVNLTKGTGGQKGHTFKVKFTGTGSAVSGTYTFKYTGTYK